uniref:Single-stranded DNA binding protein Ssb-like OB fold domain-containing protein n=1 Tax=Spongospora subterranea TaxID=70186 RepID=A0A0H5R462_9EUKA|eukprot:CRZ08990.1 hypothetical protein [Spongospora subterranea]
MAPTYVCAVCSARARSMAQCSARSPNPEVSRSSLIATRDSPRPGRMAVESVEHAVGEGNPQEKQPAAEPRQRSDQRAPALKKAVFVPLTAIEPDSAGYNLKVKVVSAKTIVDKIRPDGSRYCIGEAVVADSSACCTMTIRGAEQSATAAPGACLILRNAKTTVFEEHIRLVIDQFGLMQVDSDPSHDEVNTANDLSQVAYELVED